MFCLSALQLRKNITASALTRVVITSKSKVNGINKEIKLYEVWYVPGIFRNLFSVLAAQDKQETVYFAQQ